MTGRGLRKAANQRNTEGTVTGFKMEAILKELLPEESDPGNKNVSVKLDFLTKLLCAVAVIMRDMQSSLQFSQAELETAKTDIGQYQWLRRWANLGVNATTE